MDAGADHGRAPWNRRILVGAFASMVKSRVYTHRPFFLAHAVTFGCNSRCVMCTYWQLTPRMKEDLSTGEVCQLIDEAYDSGMRCYYAFGGEPLIRKDIGKIVDYARARGFLTTMNTNGSLLASKAESLRNLDLAFVSLDYSNEYNDWIRGRHGSFADTLRGIERLREVGNTRVTIVTTIGSYNTDAMEPMARLAKRLRVGISFNAVELQYGTDGATGLPNMNRSDARLALSPAQLSAFYSNLVRLKKRGYPLLDTGYALTHFVEGRPWTCHFPKMFVYVSPDKKIYSCDYRYGYDLRHGSFEEYFRSPQWQEHVQSAEACNRCVRTCVRGYSYAYEFRLRNLLQLAGDARTLFQSRPRPAGEDEPVPPVPPLVPAARAQVR